MPIVLVWGMVRPGAKVRLFLKISYALSHLVQTGELKREAAYFSKVNPLLNKWIGARLDGKPAFNIGTHEVRVFRRISYFAPNFTHRIIFNYQPTGIVLTLHQDDDVTIAPAIALPAPLA